MSEYNDGWKAGYDLGYDDSRRPIELDRLVAAARAWREFQHRGSLLDQKSDFRLRGDAEQAYQDLLTEIDALENVPADSRSVLYIEKDPQTLLGHKVCQHRLGTDVASD